MQINDELSNSKYIFRNCSEKGIQVNEILCTSSICINNNTLISPWLINNIKDLNKKHLLNVINFKPEILIIGSGKHNLYINSKLLFLLYSNKIGCEVMSTQAACRTYNLLTLDNRNVSVILFQL